MRRITRQQRCRHQVEEPQPGVADEQVWGIGPGQGAETGTDKAEQQAFQQSEVVLALLEAVGRQARKEPAQCFQQKLQKELQKQLPDYPQDLDQISPLTGNSIIA